MVIHNRNRACFPGLLVMLLLCCSCEEGGVSQTEMADGALLAVAGMQSLRCFELESQHWLGATQGLGYAANWLGVYGEELFVLHSLSSELLVFQRDATGLQLSRSLDLGLEAGLNPYFGSWREDGNLLVSNLLAASLSIVDPSNGVLGYLPTGQAPAGLQVIGDRVFTVCSGYDFANYQYGEGYLLVQDAYTGARLDSLHLGLNPQFLLLDHDGMLHISVTGDYIDPGYMLRVDPQNVSQADTLLLDASPGRLAVDTENRVHVAAGGWLQEGEEQGLLLRYCGSTMSELKYIGLPHGVLDVVCDSVSQRAPGIYAACMDAMQLAELRSDSLLRVYQLEDPPQAIGIWP